MTKTSFLQEKRFTIATMFLFLDQIALISLPGISLPLILFKVGILPLLLLSVLFSLFPISILFFFLRSGGVLTKP